MKKKELDKIKEYLNITDRKKIAKYFNVTEYYVSQILNDKRHNPKILDKCINTAVINKAKAEKENKKRLEKIAQL